MKNYILTPEDFLSRKERQQLMKTCREHAELDLSINFKNFGKFFKIDILAIKISFQEYFFLTTFKDISTLPEIYYWKRARLILLEEIFTLSTAY
jgi:hypothetical protein